MTTARQGNIAICEQAWKPQTKQESFLFLKTKDKHKHRNCEARKKEKGERKRLYNFQSIDCTTSRYLKKKKIIERKKEGKV